MAQRHVHVYLVEGMIEVEASGKNSAEWMKDALDKARAGTPGFHQADCRLLAVIPGLAATPGKGGEGKKEKAT